MDCNGSDIRTQPQHELQVAASCRSRERGQQTREQEDGTKAVTDDRVMWQMRMRSLQKTGELQSLS
jgi:hypothetical protein